MPDFLTDLWERIKQAGNPPQQGMPQQQALPGPGWEEVATREPYPYIERDREVDLSPNLRLNEPNPFFREQYYINPREHIAPISPEEEAWYNNHPQTQEEFNRATRQQPPRQGIHQRPRMQRRHDLQGPLHTPPRRGADRLIQTATLGNVSSSYTGDAYPRRDEGFWSYMFRRGEDAAWQQLFNSYLKTDNQRAKEIVQYIKDNNITDPVAQQWLYFGNVKERSGAENDGFVGDRAGEFENYLRKGFRWAPSKAYCTSGLCTVINTSNLPKNVKTAYQLLGTAEAKKMLPLAIKANQTAMQYTDGQPLFIISETPMSESIQTFGGHNNWVVHYNPVTQKMLSGNSNRKPGNSLGFELWNHRAKGTRKFIKVNPYIDWSRVNLLGLDRLAQQQYDRYKYQRLTK